MRPDRPRGSTPTETPPDGRRERRPSRPSCLGEAVAPAEQVKPGPARPAGCIGPVGSLCPARPTKPRDDACEACPLYCLYLVC